MLITVLLICCLFAGTAAIADQTDGNQAKTVIGPKNIYLHDGALALQARDAEQGVALTLKGLQFAANDRERKTAHSNLCAGYVLLRQATVALTHCNWVLERDSNHWRSYNNRAIAYLQLKRYEESEADIKRGQELNARSENLKEVKGMLLDEIDPVVEQISIDDRRSKSARDADKQER